MPDASERDMKIMVSQKSGASKKIECHEIKLDEQNREV